MVIIQFFANMLHGCTFLLTASSLLPGKDSLEALISKFTGNTCEDYPETNEPLRIHKS